MRINITNELLEVLSDLNRKSNRQKKAAVESAIGKYYNASAQLFVGDKTLTGKNLVNAFLNNINARMNNDLGLGFENEIRVTATPVVKRLGWWKNMWHNINHNFYRTDFERVERVNQRYAALLNTAKVYAGLVQKPVKEVKEEEPVKEDENSELDKAVFIEKEVIKESPEPETKNPEVMKSNERNVRPVDLDKEVVADADKSFILGPDEDDEEVTGPAVQFSLKDELAKAGVVDDNDIDMNKTLVPPSTKGKEVVHQEAPLNIINDEVDDLPYISKNLKLDMIEAIYKFGHQPMKDVLWAELNSPNTFTDAELTDSIKNFTSPEIMKRITAFNVDVPKYFRSQEQYQQFAGNMKNRRVDLDLTVDNAEIITMASYNKEQLEETRKYVAKHPELGYLQKPLNYKINRLSDNTMTKISYYTHDPVTDKEVDHPTYLPACDCFIVKDSGNHVFDNICKSMALGISSVKALSNDMTVLEKPDTPDRLERANAMIDIQAKSEHPSLKPRTELLSVGKDSMLINLGMCEVQSSNNGCWSVSLKNLLNYQGVDLTQKEIRAFKPTGVNSYDTDEHCYIRMKNRFNFSYLASTDSMNQITNFTELVHKTVKNAQVHSISADGDFFKNNIKRILMEKKTPVSFSNGGHYLTAVGFDGDNLIYMNSTGNTFHSGIDDEKGLQYLDYAVSPISSFNSPQMEMTWIERTDEKNLKNELKGFDAAGSTEVSGGSVKMTKALNGGIYSYAVTVPENMAKDLGIGPFAKKKIEIKDKALNENNDKEKMKDDNESIHNEFTLLK